MALLNLDALNDESENILTSELDSSIDVIGSWYSLNSEDDKEYEIQYIISDFAICTNYPSQT